MLYHYSLPHRSKMGWRVENCTEKDEKSLEEAISPQLLRKLLLKTLTARKSLLRTILKAEKEENTISGKKINTKNRKEK